MSAQSQCNCSFFISDSASCHDNPTLVSRILRLMLSASIFSQNKLCSHLMGSCHDIYIWVTIIKALGNMSVEILARQTGFPAKRESEYRISRFDLSTNCPVGGQVFPSALSILWGECRPLVYLLCAFPRLPGSRELGALFSVPLPNSPRGPPVQVLASQWAQYHFTYSLARLFIKE